MDSFHVNIHVIQGCFTGTKPQRNTIQCKGHSGHRPFSWLTRPLVNVALSLIDWTYIQNDPCSANRPYNGVRRPVTETTNPDAQSSIQVIATRLKTGHL